MRLIVIGDVHDHRERLTGTLELLARETADAVVLCGDVGRDPPRFEPARTRMRKRHDASVRAVIEGVRQALDCPVAFVPGNHDLPDPPPVHGAINVDGSVATVAGLRIAGLGGAGPARFGFPYEWDKTEAAAALARTTAECAPGELDILLSHTPPAGTTLDRIDSGPHVGSIAVAQAIERLRPRLFLCGHIHEAWGVERIHDVPCINAGALGEPYGQSIAWRIDWSIDRQGPQRVESVRRDERGEIERRTWID